MNTKPFTFSTEFTADGQVLSGEGAAYVGKDDAAQMCADARAEGEAAAKTSEEARAAEALNTMAAHLNPVEPILVDIAGQLKRDATDLALAAAKAIAGKALDKWGAETAADAISELVATLRDGPSVVATVAPDCAGPVSQRLQTLAAHGFEGRFAVKEDPAAKPGDWRVDWREGAVEFNRDEAAKAVEAALQRRMNDPVEPQLDLFAGDAA
ncbi:MAG: hypothetical protein AAF719_05890 [Pseudomonadota bacterium]